MILEELSAPIVLAPLAGGPATVPLAVSVSEAGGLGFLASGYRSAAQLVQGVEEFRGQSTRPFGVNLFAPPAATDPAAYAAYVESLRGEAARLGVELGRARFDDDDYEAKLASLEALAVPVVSFVFGCPRSERIDRLQRRGSSVWVTVTSPEEAMSAAHAGADALVVQGAEAGGHRGGWQDAGRSEPYALLPLLQLVGAVVELPLVAAGGIATGQAVAAVLAAGAQAAQLGTAFLLCPEAGTSSVHRAKLASERPTGLTKAFTGKPARGIVNRFMREHDAAAPTAYPEVHYVTSPLRQAGRERGDSDVVNLWAGQAHRLAEAKPAAEVVRQLTAAARAALDDASQRLAGSGQ